MSEIEQLLEALPKSPGMRIMHFCKEPILIEQIQKYCKSQEPYCEYLLATFHQIDADTLAKYQNGFSKVKYLNEKRPRFHIQAKQYDYLFLTTLPLKRVPFFKKVYSALKNGAPLFIVLKSKEKELANTIEAELIESNYVASNKTQLGEYLLVSAKKMHGWSGI